jgi:hypothetical protein
MLRSASDAEANRSQWSLGMMIERLLHDNQRLGKRLRNLEDSFDAMSIITRDVETNSLAPEADDATITSARPSAGNRVSILEAIKVRFAFDEDLQSSRVYRTMQNKNCNHSIVSSVIRTQTWSIFSGLSLADISVISVIALPLYPEDVQGHPKYYQFSHSTSAEITATLTHAQVIVETGNPDEDNEDIVKDTNPSSSLSTRAIPSSKPLDPLQSPRVDEQTLQVMEGHFDNLSDTIEENRLVEEATVAENGLSGESLPPSNDGHNSVDNHPHTPIDEDDDVYPCKGCGEILEEGKAFKLGKQNSLIIVH